MRSEAAPRPPLVTPPHWRPRWSSRGLDLPPDQLITGWAGQSCNATTEGTPRARREPPEHRSPDRQAPRPRRRGNNPDVQTDQRDGLPHVDPDFVDAPPFLLAIWSPSAHRHSCVELQLRPQPG